MEFEKTKKVNVDLDMYVRNFRIFYTKLITGHPQHIALSKKFKHLLQNESKKWRSQLLLTNNQEGQNSAKLFLSKAKSKQAQSQSKLNHQWLMETNSFSRAFIFIAILSLFEAKSIEGIQMIRAHLENQGVLNEGRIFTGIILKKVLYGWSKIQKLFLSTFNSKPHLSLAQSLNDFPKQFIDVLYDILTDRKIQKIGPGEYEEDKMKKLIDIIKFDKNQVYSIKKCGNYKKNMNIGYLPGEGIYVIAKQLPKKHKEDADGKTLTNLSMISNQLFKMYESSDTKLKNLEFMSLIQMKGENSRISGRQNSSKSGLESKNKLSSSMYKSRV